MTRLLASSTATLAVTGASTSSNPMTITCSPSPMRWAAAPFMQIAREPRTPAIV